MNKTYKYYVYNLVKSKFKGYKLVLELAKFGRYKNLKYDGYEVMNSQTGLYVHTLRFRVNQQSQVIRSLKLLKLDDGIKPGSKIADFVDLLGKSKELTDEERISQGGYYYIWDGYGTSGSSGVVDPEAKKEHKNRVKFSNSQIKNKFRNENKTRFRK
jgi:hypothetical protein